MSEVIDAIRYFEELGFIESMTKDKRFYTRELIAEVKRLQLKITQQGKTTAILQDALECIVETTNEDPKKIAQETLEAIAVKGEIK